ncbi:MAG: class II aldolase/adducin family protein [Anaerolineaceae bacterium]|nr:class II aldolase/adducin family protein [Anaerolineaceae bacterium]
MNQLEWNLRKDICEVGKRLYAVGFMTGSDGNLSTILNDNEILITPSRLCKGFLTPDQIVKIDRQGNQLSGDYPPTSEVAMHLAAYQERPDICAVAHCHPPILVAFTVAGIDLPSDVLPEVEVMFGGRIPLAAYATPGSPELANSIRESIRIRENSAVLLDHHGLLTVGRDIYQAAIKVEHAEAAARVIYYARQLGGVKSLPPVNLEKLHQTHQKIVEMEAGVYSGYCHAPECQIPAPQESNLSELELERIVSEVVKNALSET